MKSEKNDTNKGRVITKIPEATSVIKKADSAQEEQETIETKPGSVEATILAVADKDVIPTEPRTIETVKAEIKAATGNEPDDALAQQILDAETGEDDSPFPGEDKANTQIYVATPKPKTVTSITEEPTKEEKAAISDIGAVTDNQSFEDLPYPGDAGSGIFIDPTDLLKMHTNGLEQLVVSKDQENIELRRKLNASQKQVVEQQGEVIKRDAQILEMYAKEVAIKKGDAQTKGRTFVEQIKIKYKIQHRNWSFDPETGEVKF